MVSFIRHSSFWLLASLIVPLFAACGGDDEDEPSQSAGSGGTSSGKGGSAGASSGGTGGSAGSTGGATSGAGGSDDANGGADSPAGGAPSFDDCETGTAVESCYAENTDHPGTATCSEYYAAGQAQLFCTEPAAGACPRNAELRSICAAGISAYYYADGANAEFWSAGEGGCEVNGGTWCAP